jgi:hypothetical protein
MKNKYLEYINRFQEWNEYWIYFIENNFKEWELSQSQIEHCLDFVYSNKKKFKKIWLKTILEKADAWSKKIQDNASKTDNEIEWVDYEVVKDFWDWFKFVKLISKQCYEREWKLMSHCVWSYYWRDVNIYSLRDHKNLPHATIEEENQVKGKWNQSVDNKYFWYCIKFLEEMWFSIWENEMKNIWYYKLDTIDKDLSCEKLYDWKYVSDKDLHLIKDKNWNKYEWFWLLSIKKLFEINFEAKVKLKWNFNISSIVKYFISTSAHSATSWDSAHSATSWNYSHSATSWDYANSATSWYSAHSATSWDSAHSATSWNYSHSATSWNYSHSATSWNYSHSATSWNYSHSATSWDYANSATSWKYANSATSWYSAHSATSWYSAHSATSWDSAHSATSWNYSHSATSW